MDVVVGIAIGVLAIVFIAAFLGLIFFLKYKCREEDLISQEHKKETRPDAHLIEESFDDLNQNPEMGVELGTVQISNPKLEEILNSEQFLDDATGLIPHCLSILKSCHLLLMGITNGNASHVLTQETMTEINTAAKRINPRVDEVVQSMNVPLDPRLLEARFTALVLSVSHLVMITKKACHMPGTLDWIDKSLADMEDHLRVLREASVNVESSVPSAGYANGSVVTVEHHCQPHSFPNNDNSQV